MCGPVPSATPDRRSTKYSWAPRDQALRSQGTLGQEGLSSAIALGGIGCRRSYARFGPTPLRCGFGWAPRDQALRSQGSSGQDELSRDARGGEGDRFQCLLRPDPATLRFFGPDRRKRNSRDPFLGSRPDALIPALSLSRGSLGKEQSAEGVVVADHGGGVLQLLGRQGVGDTDDAHAGRTGGGDSGGGVFDDDAVGRGHSE